MLVTLQMSPALAAFTLNGTRFIYEEGKKGISMEITNNTKDPYGGQIWIDNVSPKTDDVWMVPSPPVFRVEPGKKQVVRLMNVSPALPADRESLFLINTQELPPVPEKSDGSVLAIAMNTRVKLIYRPQALVKGREDAEKKLTTLRQGTVRLKNPTPYWFAVTGIKVNGKSVPLPENRAGGLTMLAPFSEADTGLTAGGRLTVQAINDWGGVQDYEVQ
ncbi:MAG: fimbrial chaperone [Hafnia sp.]